MNMKDKTQRITLRLNERQFEFVKKSSDVLGVSPSEFLRMVVSGAMSMARMNSEIYNDMEKEMEKIKKVVRGGMEGRENDKTNFND